MKKFEAVFLACALLFAALFAVSTATKTLRVLSTSTAMESRAGSAGKARDIDADLFRRLIKTNRLSDHEADFYKKGSGPAAPKDGETEGETVKKSLEDSAE